MDKRAFAGKVVWITGASSGIGEALAYLFNARGARIVISSNEPGELARVKANCNREGTCVRTLPLDMTQCESFSEKVETVIRQVECVDILINNAGISHRSLARDTSPEVLRKVIDTDLTGNAALACAVLPHMIERRAGHIVVTSSLAGKMSFPTRAAYCAAKHGLHGFYNALRAEVWKDNISVTLVCPAGVRTSIGLNSLLGDGTQHGRTDKHIAQGMAPEVCARYIEKAILRRKEEIWIGKPSELGAAYIAQYAPRFYSWLTKHVRTLN